MAELIRGLSDNGGVVFCGVNSTDIVCKAEQLHKTSATCSAALGRLLTGAALMGSMLKDDRDSITLRVSGGGPAGLLIACTDGTGNVKGCIDHPLVELPPRADGHLDVGGAVGKDGVLTVIRDNRLQKEPTVGQVPLVSGEIAEDLTALLCLQRADPHGLRSGRAGGPRPDHPLCGRLPDPAAAGRDRRRDHPAGKQHRRHALGHRDAAQWHDAPGHDGKGIGRLCAVGAGHPSGGATAATAARPAPAICCSAWAARSWKSSGTKTPTARWSVTSATPNMNLT